MRGGDLPEPVNRFIVEYLDSAEQLEILLLLFRHSERDWSAEGVARELRISPLSSAERLEEFAREGLLVRGEGGAGYRFGPRDPSLVDAVRGLVAAYAERRVTVINLIFSKPVDKIRTFADAFRLRKEDDHE